jgi:hypothetical protein
MKESFVLYKSFYEPIKGLSSEDKGNLLDAIFQYQIDGIEPLNTSSIYMAFLFFKNQFRLDNEKYLSVIERNKTNGIKGGRPPKVETQINPNNPVGFQEPKKPDNDKDNDKDNDNVKVKVNNIEERKLKFASTLQIFLPQYGREVLNEFYGYWTEPNKSNTKFRQELEKTWDLNRRLERWTKSDFSKGKTISTGQSSKMESMVNSAKEALNMLQDE